MSPTTAAPALEESEAALEARLDQARLPRHLAVIMDGNGRWARQRHLPRVAGHKAGVAAVRRTAETCARLGIPVLTLYAFSVENWKRPRTEVDFLMRLLREFLRRELPTLRKNRIRLGVIGRVQELPASVQRSLHEVCEATAGYDRMLLNLALNYGSRAELADAMQALAEENGRPGKPARITEQDIERHLYTAGLPDPDLVIRTSGEMRLSNFLLWQAAYAELWVTPVLWPDFQTRELLRALCDYQNRHRRFGGLAAPDSAI